MKNILKISIAILSVTLFSCSNDDDVTPVNEEEVITTVKVTLTNQSNSIILQSQDLDGNGPEAPEITVSGNLDANTTYFGTIAFLNELENPVEDITDEVYEEGTEHQVFYQVSNALGTVTYTDADEEGNPIGINFTLETANSGSGTVTITLRHEPNKEAQGVSTGNITNAAGSTDAEVSFPITVQ